MGKRTKFEDIASMALLYTNRVTDNKIISYDKVMVFDRVINENLDAMGSEINPFLSYEEESRLFFTTTDETGKVYLVINPDADLKAAQSYHIGCLPLDVILASQMENALNVIGLQLVDGVLKKKENSKSLTMNEILERVLDNPREFFIKVSVLSIEEREYIKTLIENKNCTNCSNGTCRVENYDKSYSDACIAWDNKELIGRSRILAKNE